MMENSMSPADYAAVTGSNNRDGFGEGGGLIWIIVLLALFGGGFGGLGKNGAGADLQGIATRADITSGFALNGIENGIRGIQNGICDSTYALNNAITNGFSNNQLQLCNGFNGVERSFNQLGYQMQQCCCETQRSIDGVNYNMAKNTCDLQNTINGTTRDIIDNNNAGTRAILDFLTQDKIATLQAENQNLKFQASQSAQNGFIDAVGNSIVARVQPAPVPSYTVPAPYPYGYSGCGCNSGCGC